MHFRQSTCSLGVFVLLCASLSKSQQVPCTGYPQTTRTQHAVADAAQKPAAERTSVTASPLAHPELPCRSDADSPVSMFDAVETRFSAPVTRVEVHGVQSDLDTTEPFRAGGQEILSAAGSYGDIERFLQVLPGVVSTSDVSNEVLVRGGHPMENLFLVDGIEAPNINHVTLPNSTGGFSPMIDAAVVQGLKFYTGGYDAHYPERLSSVMSIETLDSRSLAPHAEADLGIEGVGGLLERGIGAGDLLASVHKGFLQYFNTGEIGGLPAYQNELMRYRRTAPSGSRLTILHLAGMDSVQVNPCPRDRFSTSTINSQYSGWRETTGMEWQQIYSRRAFGALTVSDSEQIENVNQQDELPDPTNPPAFNGDCWHLQSTPPPTPVYRQNSNEAFSTAGYRFAWSGSRFTLGAGSEVWLQRPHYDVQQPVGAFSPYSAAPVRTDATSFQSAFSTGESGTFAQLAVTPIRDVELSAGGRLQTFALGHHTTLTPRLSLRVDPNEHVGFHAAFASYAQVPPYAYLLAYPQNRSLLPMRATHEIVGMDLNPGLGSQIHVEAYQKSYRDIPAATEYPAVNLHNLVDMTGDQVVWLPLNSGGRGTASGIEISDVTRIKSSMAVRASLAYSRAKFAGLDGVLRPSNYDLPWIANLAVLQRLGRGYEIASRFGYATGRPYTPFDFTASLAQNRPIYEVLKMNSERAPAFARLDVQMNKDFVFRGVHMELYVGANNVLNRHNFLSYVWLPDLKIAEAEGLSPVYRMNQMPVFPNAGLRYILK